ncbi:MAG: hypothetical protein HY075_05640 [Deltaproteobacteria bacterium]|nr:hypothetical protein [Deltaproteobacteria bacterium]
MIHANTKVDAEKPAEETLEQAVAPQAPKKIQAKVVAEETAAAETTPPANTELADLKKQNAEMAKRLDSLEKARIEKKEADQSEAPAEQAATPAADETQKEALARDVAPGAESGEVGVDELVESSAAKPTDVETPATVDARLKEKAIVSKASRSELAHAQKRDDHHKELRQMASRFDTVSDKYIPDLAQRLKYTNEILKRFGRAYDYRLTTLSDFKKILAELESTEEKTNASN